MDTGQGSHSHIDENNVIKVNMYKDSKQIPTFV